MKTAIVFNEPEPGKPDSEDVLEEAGFVQRALCELGHETALIPARAGLDGLARTIGLLKGGGADVVFNLIESLGGVPRLHPIGAALLEAAGLPYTGSPYEVLYLTTDKSVCKALMEASGIPTPAWALYPDAEASVIWRSVSGSSGSCIAKPLWEDASIGITDDSVFTSQKALEVGLRAMSARYVRLLVEAFAPGREFNVSVIEGEDGTPRALPVAEMTYRDWPEGKPRIVNYRAKWDPDSFEFHNTVRAFGHEPDVEARVAGVAIEAWRAFGMRGYARVDMRLDAHGQPLVMEINANPCISPDSGFVAAAAEAGLSPVELVGGIVHAALRRRGQ